MEIHRQTCQSCGSRSVNDILVREPGQPPTVFVRCQGCGGLVARYRLSAYYHHGKGVESYLRSLSGAAESGRLMLEEFNRTQGEAVEEYERIVAALKEQGKGF